MTLVQILLPLFDNDGNRFEHDRYQAVRKHLIEQFGGLTAYTQAPATGLWETDENAVIRDDIVVYEVMTDALDRNWWVSYRKELELRFQQESLVVRATQVDIL